MKTRHFYPILFALLFLSLASQAQSYYLYFPGITIKKGIKGHSDEVFISSLSSGLSKSSLSPNPDFADYSISKSNDVTSADIFKYITAGTVTDGVEIRVYPSGATAPTLTIQLKGVVIRSLSLGGASSDDTCTTCTAITESLALSYTAIKIGTFMWDRTSNTPTF